MYKSYFARRTAVCFDLNDILQIFCKKIFFLAYWTELTNSIIVSEPILAWTVNIDGCGSLSGLEHFCYYSPHATGQINIYTGQFEICVQFNSINFKLLAIWSMKIYLWHRYRTNGHDGWIYSWIFMNQTFYTLQKLSVRSSVSEL